MLKIAMISEHASPMAEPGGIDSGGQNVYVAHLAQELGRIGHRVDVLTRRSDASQPPIVRWKENVRIVHVPAGPARFIRKEELLPHMEEFGEFAERFLQVRREAYDVVHGHFFMSGLVAQRIKRTLGLPFVMTFHALGRVRLFHHGSADTFPKERVRLEQQIIDEADGIVAECPQDEEDLSFLYRADPRRIAQIPCGFDPKELSPIEKRAARRRVQLPEEDRLLLQLGRLVPRKGIDNVIRALGRLIHDHHVEATLAIVAGEDGPAGASSPELERLRCIAKREGVEDRVLFLGRKSREELKYYYSAADVFISTPWYEPFGMTPLEAMACARPVIGSAVGGIKFTVLDNRTGYLVSPNDPGALGEKLAQLYRHPHRMRRFGERGARRAARFTWTRVAEAMERLYREVVFFGEIQSSHIFR